MTFTDYMQTRTANQRWAVAPKTARNLSRYPVCLNKSQFAQMQRDYLAEGGDANLVNPNIARESGFDLVWAQVAA